jgi:hypothetical protein
MIGDDCVKRRCSFRRGNEKIRNFLKGRGPHRDGKFNFKLQFRPTEVSYGWAKWQRKLVHEGKRKLKALPFHGFDRSVVPHRCTAI